MSDRDEKEKEAWCLLCFKMLSAISDLEESTARWQALYEQSEALRSQTVRKPAEESAGLAEMCCLSRWVN